MDPDHYFLRILHPPF